MLYNELYSALELDKEAKAANARETYLTGLSLTILMLRNTPV